MPAKLFPSAERFDRTLYVKTGAFRPPRKGEAFLSGAIPEVYRASCDAKDARDIMREATETETRCAACGQRLPVSGRA